MKTILVCERTPELIESLTELWEDSVKATHLFLTAPEIEAIKKYVPQALREVHDLVIAENDNEIAVGFMGVENDRLEMLFISPEERGKGIGRTLVQRAIEEFFVEEVTVNEQNPQAVGFYERMGFKTYKKTDLDEQGNPYPLLYMRL